MFNEGDFSFCGTYKHVFEYDYKVVNKLGEIAWNKIKTYDFELKRQDYIMDAINEQLYPGHSALTYKMSMENLRCISIHGWESFVNKTLKK